jgi:hypothetical protein
MMDVSDPLACTEVECQCGLVQIPINLDRSREIMLHALSFQAESCSEEERNKCRQDVRKLGRRHKFVCGKAEGTYIDHFEKRGKSPTKQVL